jgi:hypothetical protein
LNYRKGDQVASLARISAADLKKVGANGESLSQAQEIKRDQDKNGGAIRSVTSKKKLLRMHVIINSKTAITKRWTGVIPKKRPFFWSRSIFECVNVRFIFGIKSILKGILIGLLAKFIKHLLPPQVVG